MKIEARSEKINALRKKDIVPGVLFGKTIDSTSVQAPASEVEQAYKTYGSSQVFKIKLGTKMHQVYFKDLQRDILKPSKIVHFGLLKISANDTMTAMLPVVLLNKNEVERQGLVVQQVIKELEVEYPVSEGAPTLELDIAHLNYGDAVHVKDLNLPENLKISVSVDEMIANIIYPKVKEEATEELAEADKVAETEEETN